MGPPEPISARANTTALVFAMVFPSVLTWAYFVLLAGQPTTIPQAVYAGGKLIQFAFPLVWVVAVQRKPLRLTRPRGEGIFAGLAFGVLVLVAMLALYHVALKPLGFFDAPGQIARQKLMDLGIASLAAYIATGLFYALFHSLLEEYYWRWYVFGQLRDQVSTGRAVVISSLAFMAHHVILLATYFGWFSWATYLFAFGVAVGGAVWAWMYHQSRSLYGVWLSHCLVDAAIFLVGFDLVRDLLVS
jgi:membrane protease YdiL (CAAX protease family)